MTQDALPAPVLDLVAHSIASMEQIDVLLALQADGAVSWQADEMARKLQIAPAAAAASLAALKSARLAEVSPDGGYRYAPGSAALRDAVAQLVVAYNTRPVTLIKAIYNRPPKAITSFADAFRIRGSGEDR